MKWLDRLRRSIFPDRRCALCHRRVSGLRNYVNDRGDLIKVCPSCGEYAERRAFRKR